MRVIRQSRLEYLKLRSILMAPLQPSRGKTSCLADLDPQQRDKTVQNSESHDTTPLQQNDLQQPEPAASHSENLEGRVMRVPNPPAHEPQTSPTDSDTPSHSPTFPPAHLPELEPGDAFTGSIAYTHGECAQAIILKSLEAERLHRERQSVA